MAEAKTLVHKIREWAEKHPDAPSVNGRGATGWVTKTWREYDQVVRRVGKALIALGHKPGDRVSIVGRNRPEWLFSQFGIMNATGVPAPIYSTETASQTAYVVNHSGARFAIVENKEQYEKLASERKNVPKLEKVIVMDAVEGRDPQWTLLWSELLAKGEGSEHDAELEKRLAGVDPDALAFLCYTSGTTGKPKGVMLSNTNLTHMGRVGVERFALDHEKVISYLPLCHMAEQFFTNLVQLFSGGQVFMCDELSKVKELLPDVRPTMFLGVPRVWEKFEAALRARLAEATGVKAKLASWALATELESFRADLKEGRPSSSLSRKLARKLVISKIKDKLGLDQVKYACTGAAPIGLATQEFFASLALPITEGYGMSETSALLTTTLPGKPRFGTVGKPFPGVELKLAEDGEIIARGPNLTKGYYEDVEQTTALWEGGWLHTGDIGVFDEEGNLKIVDRKKELFKTSGAKYVAPQAIEGRLKSIRGVSQAVAIGDARNYICALLTLDPENAPKVAVELGCAKPNDLAALATDEKMNAHFRKEVEARANAFLARYEQVKKFVILPADFSVATGELTPTMKLKRKIVSQKYATQIEGLYKEEPATAGAAR
jgi:long-chain acyl-CoA synthetase